MLKREAREIGVRYRRHGRKTDDVRDFRKLIAWQRAHRLAVEVHVAAAGMQTSRAPGLRAQLLRAASSIPANIAEGCGKRSESEFARYLDIALGSARELENHLLLARDLDCFDSGSVDGFSADVDEVRRILFALSREVRRRS
jgi:four helix bundle protein